MININIYEQEKEIGIEAETPIYISIDLDDDIKKIANKEYGGDIEAAIYDIANSCYDSEYYGQQFQEDLTAEITSRAKAI